MPLGQLPLKCGSGPSYVEMWLQHFEASRGSAYTKDPNTAVHCENEALARRMAAVSLCADGLTWQAIPGTATDSLRSWAERLGIVITAHDTEHSVRQACEAKYRAIGRNAGPDINEAVSKLLGTAFTSVQFFFGASLSAPPSHTYWGDGELGPANLDLGGSAGDPFTPQDTHGAWATARNHVVIEVQQPNGMSWADFVSLVHGRLYQLLDLMLPAYTTFDAALRPFSPFILDVSKMDWTSLS